MPLPNSAILRAALRTLSATGADRLLAPFTQGLGAIFMLHHVTPVRPPAFSPNRILAITPQFLEEIIDEVVRSGFDVISLDEVPERIAQGAGRRPFACFTFDDGYRDNRDYAYPIFKARNLPMAVYVPTAFADGRGDLWWLVLEESIRRSDTVLFDFGAGPRTLPSRSVREKDAAYDEIYWWLRRQPEDEARAAVAELAQRAGFDPEPLCRSLVMSWEELARFAEDPLVTIGAHTVGHYALAKLPAQRAKAEMADGIARLENQLQRPCVHFSYPYGSECAAGEREFELARQLGMKTAVTTRKGLIHPLHADQLTGLPRLSLNGNFQDVRLMRTLLTGVPFALMGAASRLRGPAQSTAGGRFSPSALALPAGIAALAAVGGDLSLLPPRDPTSI